MEETRTYEEVFWENKELKEKLKKQEKDIEDLKQAIKWRDNIIQNQNNIIRQK